MTTHEAGRADAIARKKASSTTPEYQGGYLDGLFERSAATATASFRQSTISGMVIEALTTEDGATYSVRSHTGKLLCTGAASDIEAAVAAAESDIVGMGHLAVRIEQIVGTINKLHPAMSSKEQYRLAAKAAQYILEHARGTSAA